MYPYILFPSAVLKYYSRRFLLSLHVSLLYSTNRRSSERRRENWTMSLSPDIFPTSMMSPLCPILQPSPWRLCDGGMLLLLVWPRKTLAFSIYCLMRRLAVPHFLDVEDEYKGYRLPARSIIIPNAWSVTLVLSDVPFTLTF